MEQTQTKSNPFLADVGGGQPKQLEAALALAQQRIVSLGKDAKNKFNDYDYLSSEKAIKDIKAALYSEGLFVRALRTEVEVIDPNTAMVTTTYRLSHPDSGEFEIHSFQLPAVTRKGTPLDKATLGTVTSSINYYLRGLIMAARGDKDEVCGRDDSSFDPQNSDPYYVNEEDNVYKGLPAQQKAVEEFLTEKKLKLKAPTMKKLMNAIKGKPMKSLHNEIDTFIEELRNAKSK